MKLARADAPDQKIGFFSGSDREGRSCCVSRESRLPENGTGFDEKCYSRSSVACVQFAPHTRKGRTPESDHEANSHSHPHRCTYESMYASRCRHTRQSQWKRSEPRAHWKTGCQFGEGAGTRTGRDPQRPKSTGQRGSARWRLVSQRTTGVHRERWRAAEGANPVISGGEKITGWQKQGDRWVAKLPEVAAGKWTFRELYVNGRWAQRARWPNASLGTARASGPLDIAKADVEAKVDQGAKVKAGEKLPFIPWPQAKGRWTRESCVVAFPTGTLPAWSNIEDVELHYSGAWDVVVKQLASQDGDTITLKPPHAFFHQNISPNGRADRVRWCHFENAPEMLDAPGEWVLDRTSGTLSYLPLPGESIDSVQVVAPKIGPSVIVIEGTASDPVEHLHFSGITVAHVGLALPEQGYNGLQAGAHFPPVSDEQVKTMPVKKGLPKVDHAISVPALTGALKATGWQHGSFQDGSIRQSATYGMHLSENCRDLSIRGNRFHLLGGGGIRVGENWRHHYASGGSYKPIDPALHAELSAKATRRIQITNNVVHDTGRNFWGTVGIWSSAAFELTIAHNDIFDLPYSGISSGWFWKDNRPLANGQITIKNNRITNILNRLADGGGVYCLGSHPDSAIQGNVMIGTGRNRFTHRFPHYAIYLDGDGVRGLDIQGNLFGYATRDKAKSGQNTWGANAKTKGGSKSLDALLKGTGRPAEQAIFDAAGLEPAYQHLRK